MDRIGKPAHENFTSAVYLQVQRDFFCLKKVEGGGLCLRMFGCLKNRFR